MLYVQRCALMILSCHDSVSLGCGWPRREVSTLERSRKFRASSSSFRPPKIELDRYASGAEPFAATDSFCGRNSVKHLQAPPAFMNSVMANSWGW